MYNPLLHFHLVGIGGSGMSGIAEVLLQEGFRVSGTDAKESETVERLRAKGARVSIGHSASHLPEDCSVVVFSSAVRAENPELVAAHERGIPVVRRAEVLSELMRLKFGVGVAGSHGKTTTTTFIGAVLERGGLDPTVVIGGRVEALAAAGKRGKGQYLVAETDESDRSFLLMRPTIGVVTNIDAEHLSAYGSFADLVAAFRQFIDSVPFYGLAVLCADCPQARQLTSVSKRRTVTYGVSPEADIRADNFSANADGASADLYVRGQLSGRIRVRFPARHLLINSLAAVAVGLEFGIKLPTILEGLLEVSGIERRMQVIGTKGGRTIMSDYGHHPTEVRTTLAAIKESLVSEGQSLRVIFQPHRYSRTQECYSQFMDCFESADQLVLTEIYSAGEEPIEGISGQGLADSVRHNHVIFRPTLAEAEKVLAESSVAGDILICMGAGTVGGSGKRLLDLL